MIHFIMTGGTIDSYFDGTKDTVVPRKHSVLPEYLSGIKIPEKVFFTEVCMKDSRALTHNDINTILRVTQKSKHKHIIVTHGTYTMVHSAKYLIANLKTKSKVVIFTGSFIPISGFTFSDAPFNLGFAIAQSKVLKPGVYVAMHGKIYDPEKVTKIVSKGQFVSLVG